MANKPDVPILTEEGQSIQKFCEENPAVVFNAPPELQEDYMEKISQRQRPWCMDRILFEDRLVRDFLEKVKVGDMLLILTSNHKGWVTLQIKAESFYKDSEFPPNWRIDFSSTKTYNRSLGGNFWSGHITAITTIRKLKRQMCWEKNALGVFFQKAEKYAVTPEDLHRLQLKIVLAETAHPVHEVCRDKIQENKVYYLRDVSSEDVVIGGAHLQKGMLLTLGAVNFINKQTGFDSISIEIHPKP